MTRPSRIALVSLCAVAMSLTAGVCLSEVRARETNKDATIVDVLAGERGVWSARAPSDPHVLNPQGDLLGDGYPSIRVDAASGLVAWTRSSDGSVRVANWTGEGWTDLQVWEGQAAVGSPVIGELNTSHFVAWQGLDLTGESSVMLAPLSRDQSEPGSIAVIRDAQLLGLVDVADGSGLLLARHEPDGRVRLIWAFPIDNPDEPILDYRLETLTLTGAGSVLGGDWQAVSDPESPSSLLLWWEAPGTLAGARVDGSGYAELLGVLEHPGSAARPQGLVRRAVREWRDVSAD